MELSPQVNPTSDADSFAAPVSSSKDLALMKIFEAREDDLGEDEEDEYDDLKNEVLHNLRCILTASI